MVRRKSVGPSAGTRIADARRESKRRRPRLGRRRPSTAVLVFVVLDGVVHGREEMHRGEPSRLHAIVHVAGQRGHVHGKPGIVELVHHLREHGQPGRVDVVHASQVEYQALRAHHHLLAVVDRYGNRQRFAVVPGQHVVDFLPEHVAVGDVQAAGIMHDPDPRHLDRPLIPVHVHVQVGVGYTAQHGHGAADALAEHEEQRDHHAGQQSHVDLDQHHCQIGNDPYDGVRFRRFPDAHDVAHLQQYVF